MDVTHSEGDLVGAEKTVIPGDMNKCILVKEREKRGWMILLVIVWVRIQCVCVCGGGVMYLVLDPPG